MRVLVLGAGQDVGRSCVVVRIGGKTLMFDCGMHMGYSDARRFPDFSLLGPNANFTSLIDAVFISHFHMDHVGALPYFTEVCGYDGPVFMTHPTRAIAPIMLHDFFNVLKKRTGTGPVFAEHHIDASMAKVRLMDLQETVQVCHGVEVTAYYAGHVLGAAMLHVRVGSESLVYTGDFNTVPERHLAGASIPRLCPDLLITESTYATSIREDRRSRERQLLNLIDQTVTAGGKVLVPVFAVGRAQELLMLLDEHWQRTGLEVPIYVSSIMASRANAYFKLLQNWASERVKQAAPGCRAAAFDFSRVQDWQPELVDQPGACVLFATPGMLHGGTSLDVFKAWAPDPKNLVLLPSYQVAGTVGRKLMLGVRKGLQIDARTKLDVRCKVDYAALSAHTDAKGILQIVQQVAPAAVMLVHGEPDKMQFMSERITRSLNILCFMPANGEEVSVESGKVHNIPVSAQILRQLPATIQQLQQQLSQGGVGQSVPNQGSSALHRGTEFDPHFWSEQQQQQQQQQQGVFQVGTDGQGALAAGVVSGQGHVGQAVAGWLQQGDIGQLAATAMKLAGLAPAPQAPAAAGLQVGQPAADADQQQQQQQQQMVQMHGSAAAARAAQIAPWLELLAAAAQETTVNQQQQQQQQGQQAQQGIEGVDSAAGADLLQSSLVSVSAELQQQLQLKQQAVVVDGVLLVHHAAAVHAGAATNGSQDGAVHTQQQQQQQQVARMELLPAASAAAALQMQQHQIKLSCNVNIPAECLRMPAQAVSGQQSTGLSEQQQAAAATSIADILRAGLSRSVAQTVQVTGVQVGVRSILFQHAAEARDDSCWKCSWNLTDDALAQQCVSLIKQQVAL